MTPWKGYGCKSPKVFDFCKILKICEKNNLIRELFNRIILYKEKILTDIATIQF